MATRAALVIALAAPGACLSSLPAAPSADPTPAGGQLPGYHYAVDGPLTGWSDPRLVRQPGEDALRFAERVTAAVGRAVYNCVDPWNGGLAALVSERLVRLNEIGVLSPAHLRCGLCHQSAYVVAESLSRGGVPANVYAVNGHVVTRFHIDQVAYLADADIGVAPFTFAEGREEDVRDSVRQRYAAVLEGHLPPAAADDWAERVAGMIASRGDNLEYFTMEYLRRVEQVQAILFGILPAVVCSGHALLALALIALLPGRWPRAASQRPAATAT